MLSEDEMKQLGKDVDQDWRTTRKVMSNSSPVCCLLDGKCCTVYEKRPTLCRIYPFLGIPLADLTNLGIEVPGDTVQVIGEDNNKYVIIYDERCPGLGRGSLCDYSGVVALTISHMSGCFGNALEIPVAKKSNPPMST
jgi:Fe-S-cluster containining protein